MEDSTDKSVIREEGISALSIVCLEPSNELSSLFEEIAQRCTMENSDSCTKSVSLIRASHESLLKLDELSDSIDASLKSI